MTMSNTSQHYISVILILFISIVKISYCINSTASNSLQLKLFLSVENSTSNAAPSSSNSYYKNSTNAVNYAQAPTATSNITNSLPSLHSLNSSGSNQYYSYQSINGTVYIPPPPILVLSATNLLAPPPSLQSYQTVDPSVVPIYVTVISGLPPYGKYTSSPQIVTGLNGTTTTVYESTSKSNNEKTLSDLSNSSEYAKTIKRPKPNTPGAASFSSGSNATVAMDSVSSTINQSNNSYPIYLYPWANETTAVHRPPPPNIASPSSSSSSSNSSSLSYYIPPLNPSMVSSISMLTNGISEFATRLYLIACQNNKNNIALSTLAAQLSLALLYCGAQGGTAIQMEEALQFRTATQQQIADSFHALLTPLQQQAARLDTANGIFINRRHYVQSLYKTMAAYQFYAKVQSISFENSNLAADIINNYVKNKTENYIANLIQSKWIHANQSIIMVNAVRFKGLWQHAFDETTAKNIPFYSYFNGGKQSGTVDMMHVLGTFNYGKISNLQSYAIEMPYRHINMSMIILLPYDWSKFAALQSGLGNASFLFSSLNSQMKSQQVNVHLPKFDIDYEVPNMKHFYEKMGLGIIFQRANFNGIIQESASSSFQLSVRVNRITHKTYFEVDRFGTRAEATNEFLNVPFAMNPASAIPQFNADHSFVYAVQYKGEIVFIGRYVNP